jgi:hypothetical protein
LASKGKDFIPVSVENYLGDLAEFLFHPNLIYCFGRMPIGLMPSSGWLAKTSCI